MWKMLDDPKHKLNLQNISAGGKSKLKEDI